MSRSSGIRLLLSFIFVVAWFIPTSRVHAQCQGLPPVAALGSNKFPVGLCAPVNANVTYAVTFTSPVPAGTLELVYDWGDGTAAEVIPLTTGDTKYQAARTHSFPVNSDCEYPVVITIRYNGKYCTTTRQLQKIASWRTDNFNGGNIGLVSPVNGLTEHYVCEGQDIDVVFDDETQWNCNAQYIQTPPNPIESPNIENRWQQIIYNTGIASGKIPNVKVNGVAVTGAGGADIISNYNDPRGIAYMASPVYIEDARRRPSLQITAPGGFGAGFPKAGDAFAITLRYWNFCNPYDDPNIPGPPADLANGDNAPIVRTSYIKIVAPPVAPTVASQTVCNGTTPTAFTVSNVPAANMVRWYTNIPNPDRPGNLIATGKTLAVTAHPDWKGNTVAGALKVWASHQATTGGTTNCESPKTLAVRTIREALVVPDAITPVPTEVCNNSTLVITLPSPPAENFGGATAYTWTGSTGVKLTSSNSSSATFAIGITNFGTALYIDRTITVSRQYTTAPTCAGTRIYNIRIYKPAVAGNLSAAADVCETTAVNPITLTGYTGNIVRWEVKKDAGSFNTYTGSSSGATITPGILPAGRYTFRAIVKNGGCNEVYSNEENVEVFAAPAKADAGNDQFICTSLSSAAMNASNPAPGIGTWTYVSSIPAGLPPPVFTTNAHDPNTSIAVSAANAGAYRMRWTVTNGLCSSTDDVIIDFGTTPSDAHAGDDKAVCGSETTLEGNVPAVGLGTWTVVSGPNGCAGDACGIIILDPSSPSSSVKLAGTPVIYGSYIFRWSIASGGNNCFQKSDDVTIRFEEPVQVKASDIYDICLDVNALNPIPLTGTVTGPFQQVTWTNVSGKGTVTATTVKGSGIYTAEASYVPTAEDYNSGIPIQVKLVADANAASICSTAEQLVTITFDRKPVANAGTDLTHVCDNAIKLNAAPPVYGAVGTWTTTQPGVTFDNPKDPFTTVRNLPAAPSQTVVTWTLTSASGKCVSAPSSITLTRVDVPPVINLTATTCEVGNNTTNIVLTTYENAITSLQANAREITWYRDAAPPAGIPVADPAVAQTNVANGQVYIARVREISTTCTSDAKLTINVRPLPRVMNSLTTLCEDTPGSHTVFGINLNEARYTSAITQEPNVTITWFNSETDAFNNTSPLTAPITVFNSRDVYARVTYRDTPSCTAIGKLSILINSSPAITTIYGREAVCQTSPLSQVEIYQVPPIPGAKYYWEVPGQFTVFGGGQENDFYVMLQFPNIYTGKIKVRAALNGCSGSTVEKEIKVLSAPVKPVITGAGIVCENSGAVAFRVSPDNYPTSTYNWEIRRTSDNSPGGADIVEGQSTGNILVNFQKEDVILTVRENNTFCVSPDATKVVNVVPVPKAGLSIEKEITCFQQKDGAIRTTVTGGTAPYMAYTLLQTGATDANNDGIFENLGQGSYTVKVKDSNGCEATSNVQVLTQPDQVSITSVKVLTDANGFNVSCKDASDGEITVSFSGGNSNADYTAILTKAGSTTPVNLNGRNNITFSNLSAGTYTVTVQDSKGCMSLPVNAFLINPPVFYSGMIGTSQNVCSGADAAIINELAPASGGTGNYTYEWQESLTGNVNNDADWVTIEGATGTSYDPPALTVTKHYRRLVRSISMLHGTPSSCEVKGKTDKVTITVNPIPTVSFQAATAQVCYGDPLLLTLNLTTGTAPIEYEYTSALTGTSVKRQGGKNTIITIADFKEDDIYSIISVTDANGCQVKQLPAPVSVKSIKVNPDFTVVGTGAQCDGSDFIFTWTVEKDIDYRWEWSDGTITEFKSGAIPVGLQQTQHRFPAGSNEESAIYSVKLFARHPACMEKYTSHDVTVFPSIALNVTASESSLCSGETITFYDNSSGIDKGTWYYRELGSAARLGEKQKQRMISYNLANITSKDIVTYEVVYEASNNEGCKAIYKKQVPVYRGTVVDFEVGPIVRLKGDVFGITFTNTSPSIEPQYFDYTWDFGPQSNAVTNTTTYCEVQYYTPGDKNVTLSAVNRKASQAGEFCASTITKLVSIPVSELHAAFSATPTAACFPVDIVVNNTSTGADAFLWKVYNQGNLVTTSNLLNPVFKITDPGVYDIYLTATYSTTGQSLEAQQSGIQVFDVPEAAFGVRSNLVYVPDTELQVMNFSTGADEYIWDFGDGGTSSDFEPHYTYQSEGKYMVKLQAGKNYGDQDRNGDGITDGPMVCYDSAQQEVVAVNGGSIVIPNAFTPNTGGPSGGRVVSGGINDVFMPKVKGVAEYTMQIYNRWGTLIFESHEADMGWDGYDRHGKLLPAGVYVYKISLTQSDGQRITRLGDVTLIR